MQRQHILEGIQTPPSTTFLLLLGDPKVLLGQRNIFLKSLLGHLPMGHAWKTSTFMRWRRMTHCYDSRKAERRPALISNIASDLLGFLLRSLKVPPQHFNQVEVPDSDWIVAAS